MTAERTAIHLTCSVSGLLRRWLAQVNGRGGCAHPGGAVRLVRSALRTFGHEIETITATGQHLYVVAIDIDPGHHV